MTAIPLPQRQGVGVPHAGDRPQPTARPGRHEAPRRAAQPRASLRAVPQTAPRQLVPTWLYSLVAVVTLMSGVIGIVALNALAAEASFQARSLEAAISDATLQHDDLVAAVAVLEAPGRVREVAQRQLGLIEPEQPGFLTLDPSQLTPAQPKPMIQTGE